jgi:hypothetical protein
MVLAFIGAVGMLPAYLGYKAGIVPAMQADSVSYGASDARLSRLATESSAHDFAVGVKLILLGCVLWAIGAAVLWIWFGTRRKQAQPTADA